MFLSMNSRSRTGGSKLPKNVQQRNIFLVLNYGQHENENARNECNIIRIRYSITGL